MNCHCKRTSFKKEKDPFYDYHSKERCLNTSGIKEQVRLSNSQLLERLSEGVEKKKHAFLEDYRESDKLLSIGHNEALDEVKSLIQEEKAKL